MELNFTFILIALVLAFIAWRFLVGLVKFAVVALILVVGVLFMTGVVPL
ncbi:hypothetical protein [Sphingomicrobium arenosum]|nr:hypothetical protein [Sphingomicrobium arenosum]